VEKLLLPDLGDLFDKVGNADFLNLLSRSYFLLSSWVRSWTSVSDRCNSLHQLLIFLRIGQRIITQLHLVRSRLLICDHSIHGRLLLSIQGQLPTIIAVQSQPLVKRDMELFLIIHYLVVFFCLSKIQICSFLKFSVQNFFVSVQTLLDVSLTNGPHAFSLGFS
jgi:hypothetical protein